MGENSRPEEGSEMGTKNEPKKSLKLRGFRMVKPFKSVVRLSSKIKVSSFLVKSLKM